MFSRLRYHLERDYRADVLEVTLPPRKRLCIAPGPRYGVEESLSTPIARPTGCFRADYDEIAKEIPANDVAKLGQRMTNFVTTVRNDTDEIYGRLDDTQDDRSLMSARSDVSALRTMILAQQTEIGDLRVMAALQSQQTPARDPTHPNVLEEADSIIFSCELKKMAPKRTTRSTPATTTIITTSVTDEQLKRLIAQGVANVLAEREAPRSRNGKGSHDSGMGGRRQVLEFLI
ncbi:hypothetical protein Tco_0628869 [Tanacetum coccineum]|uniref:Uncharacterized protein n=1 Tax=Tanacetum coccineum TaxID=301880 RepID=A0ABQ4WRM0_9ASTR